MQTPTPQMSEKVGTLIAYVQYITTVLFDRLATIHLAAKQTESIQCQAAHPVVDNVWRLATCSFVLATIASHLLSLASFDIF